MNSLEGLYIYEQVLLILGVVLFAASIFILVFSFIKKEKLYRTVPFFIVAIIMAGFPGIQKIEIEKDKIAIQTNLRNAVENPSASKYSIQIKQNTVEVAQRPNLSSETLLKVTFLQSLYFPEQFDSFIEINKYRYDSKFFSCLNVVKKKVEEQALIHNKKCKEQNDLVAREQCLNQNEPMKMLMMLIDIERVIRGDVLWSKTLSGYILSMTKGLLDEKFNKILSLFQTYYEDMLSCSGNR